jgi:hypothetical protein
MRDRVGVLLLDWQTGKPLVGREFRALVPREDGGMMGIPHGYVLAKGDVLAKGRSGRGVKDGVNLGKAYDPLTGAALPGWVLLMTVADVVRLGPGQDRAKAELKGFLDQHFPGEKFDPKSEKLSFMKLGGEVTVGFATAGVAGTFHMVPTVEGGWRAEDFRARRTD